MHKNEVFQNIMKYQNEVSALAMVVRRESPSSGKPGDKAIITRTGEVHGWIGGGCTKGIVIKEALEAIQNQSPRLVRIEPSLNSPKQDGVKNYRMTCASSGSVDVYIEPLIPMTNIYIFGRSHIAKMLVEIGTTTGYRMHLISDLADDGMFEKATIQTLKNFDKQTDFRKDFVVVCTQGEDDAKSLATAIRTRPSYLAFVASRRKANAIFMELKREGVPHDDLLKIKTPAGININAKTAEEVAISILAEIIAHKHSEQKVKQEEEQELHDLYINPVCKIPIQKSTAKHVLEHNGEKVYFCCDGCMVSFKKAP